MKRLLKIPYTFVLLNWAAVAGLFHFLRGHKDVWTKNRFQHVSSKHHYLPGRSSS